EAPRLALSVVRPSLFVLLLCALPALAGAAVPTEAAGTLGRPDLASTARVVALVPLGQRQILAVDAAGLARLWDIADWQQLGVGWAGPGGAPGGWPLWGDASRRARPTGAARSAPRWRSPPMGCSSLPRDRHSASVTSVAADRHGTSRSWAPTGPRPSAPPPTA